MSDIPASPPPMLPPPVALKPPVSPELAAPAPPVDPTPLIPVDGWLEPPPAEPSLESAPSSLPAAHPGARSNKRPKLSKRCCIGWAPYSKQLAAVTRILSAKKEPHP